MKKFIDTVKLSGIMSGYGLISLAGFQYIFAYPMEMPYKIVTMFILSTISGTASKYITERLTKKDN